MLDEVLEVLWLGLSEEEVRVFSERYGIIRSRALTPTESLTLIEKMLGER
ncbi:hypothetical protein [Streptomyces sp. NBC_00057]